MTTQSGLDKGDSPKWYKTLLICVAIIALAVASTAFIFYTEPGAVKEGAKKETAMLVEVTEVKRDTYRPRVVATGTVIPAQEVMLSARVNGEVLSLTPNMIPGGFIEQDEVIVRLDKADHEIALQRRINELKLAKAELNMEMGQQSVARTEYELMQENLGPERKALVLREPQLDIARAKVANAEAAVKQANLDLSRTEIRAPFSAQVVQRHVNVGSQVSQGTQLARIINVDSYWVEALVPLAKLESLSFADTPGVAAASARVRHRTAWSAEEYRQGKLLRLVGELNPQTRLARVLISVSDPLGRETEGVSPLMLGSFVEVHIDGKPLTEVVRLSRDYLRTNNTVWVMKKGVLDIRTVDIRFKDEGHVYIAKGLHHGEQVVTSNLASITQGAKLRVAPAKVGE